MAPGRKTEKACGSKHSTAGETCPSQQEERRRKRSRLETDLDDDIEVIEDNVNPSGSRSDQTFTDADRETTRKDSKTSGKKGQFKSCGGSEKAKTENKGKGKIVACYFNCMNMVLM